MLKSKKEIHEFIATVFGSFEIKINGVTASSDDLVRLCEDVSCGKTNIKPPQQFMSAGQIKKIWVTTID